MEVSLGHLEGYRQHEIERQEEERHLEIKMEWDLRLILRRNHCGPKISKSVTLSQFCNGVKLKSTTMLWSKNINFTKVSLFCKGVSGDLFQEYIALTNIVTLHTVSTFIFPNCFNNVSQLTHVYFSSDHFTTLTMLIVMDNTILVLHSFQLVFKNLFLH